jgi:hypothetical protein
MTVKRMSPPLSRPTSVLENRTKFTKGCSGGQGEKCHFLWGHKHVLKGVIVGVGEAGRQTSVRNRKCGHPCPHEDHRCEGRTLGLGRHQDSCTGSRGHHGHLDHRVATYLEDQRRTQLLRPSTRFQTTWRRQLGTQTVAATLLHQHSSVLAYQHSLQLYQAPRGHLLLSTTQWTS